MKLTILIQLILVCSTVCVAELPYSLQGRVGEINTFITFTEKEIEIKNIDGNPQTFKYSDVRVEFFPAVIYDGISISIISNTNKSEKVSFLGIFKSSNINSNASVNYIVIVEEIPELIKKLKAIEGSSITQMIKIAPVKNPDYLKSFTIFDNGQVQMNFSLKSKVISFVKAYVEMKNISTDSFVYRPPKESLELVITPTDDKFHLSIRVPGYNYESNLAFKNSFVSYVRKFCELLLIKENVKKCIAAPALA
jgi:hypothetical protein